MRVVLFGLTGQGNETLAGLLWAGCQVEAVFTRREAGPYPYYKETQLDELAARHEIKVFYDLADFHYDPDLILVSTYHLKIPDAILRRARVAINLHPSLLPKYRGPTPIAWAMRNKETKTGVTAHRITSEIDWGPVYSQVAVPILKTDSEGDLRSRLATVGRLMAMDLVRRIETETLESTPMPGERTPVLPRLGGIGV